MFVRPKNNATDGPAAPIHMFVLPRTEHVVPVRESENIPPA